MRWAHPDDRAAYRDGRFDRALRDAPFQCIPSSWAMAAQARWTKAPPAGLPMTGMGVDVAQGGAGTWTCAPFDIDQGALVDTSGMAVGTWSLEAQ